MNVDQSESSVLKFEFIFLCKKKKKDFLIWLVFNGILNEFVLADLFNFFVMESYWEELMEY